MAFTVFTLLYAFAFFQLFSTLPVYYRKELQLSERIIGATMAGNGLMIALFEMVLVFRLEGKRHPLQYIPIGTLMMAVSFILFNLMTGSIAVAVLQHYYRDDGRDAIYALYEYLLAEQNYRC